ncbi:MAG: hypothetical protein ACXWQZ_15040 [Ktedonobacterales bacterium]
MASPQLAIASTTTHLTKTEIPAKTATLPARAAPSGYPRATLPQMIPGVPLPATSSKKQNRGKNGNAIRMLRRLVSPTHTSGYISGKKPATISATPARSSRPPGAPRGRNIPTTFAVLAHT